MAPASTLDRPARSTEAASPCGPLPGTDEIVCHCLQVTASAIRAAASIDGCRSVRDVLRVTDAGGGCTACHHRIAQLLP